MTIETTLLCIEKLGSNVFVQGDNQQRLELDIILKLDFESSSMTSVAQKVEVAESFFKCSGKSKYIHQLM